MSAVAARLLATVPLLVRRALFAAAAVAVLTLSLTPVAHLPSQVFDLWDKAQHAGGFAVLAALGFWAWSWHTVRVWLGLLAYGAFIEVAQSATGWRYGDALDWLADAAGVGLGWALWVSVQRIWKTG